VESIVTQVDFIAFVWALSSDFVANKEDWQHWDIDHYLEALAAWTDGSMEGYFRKQGLEPPEQPNWQVFADMLFTASMYE
jgi:hypothetical protein